MAARALLVLSIVGTVHAVLHASLAVDQVGTLKVSKPAAQETKPWKTKAAWSGVPVISASGVEVGSASPSFTGKGAVEPMCSPLTSHSGVVYTVRVDIGSPAQGLDVVVDTGSNLLVAEDCKCKQRGYCNPINKCFKEVESSTLKVDTGPKGPATTVLNFGSGSILTVVANDVVQIGKASTKMEHGVLLMIDQLLDFGGPFEGILGLGLPNSTSEPEALDSTWVPRAHGASTEKAWRRGGVAALNRTRLHRGAASQGTQAEPVIGGGFMQQAGIDRFSVCFTDSPGDGKAADAGELHFNPPEAPQALRSIGTMHWGLDFRGVSVGDAPKKLDFCSGSGMPPSQQTPCGAIPDSGTTLIAGPQDQVLSLFEEICNQWSRCSGNYTALAKATEAAKKVAPSTHGANLRGIQPMSKSMVFQMLLQDCESWMDEAAGMNELPPIHFHVADDTGLAKTLTLDGSLYTVAMQEPEVEQVTEHIPGFGDIPIGTRETGRIVWMCRAAFSSLDYPTAHNGPAWILGMPVFHQYAVGFNVAAKPPTISFTEGQCGSCGSNGGAKLLKPAASGSHSSHRPRRVEGRPRLPKIDITQPF